MLLIVENDRAQNNHGPWSMVLETMIHGHPWSYGLIRYLVNLVRLDGHHVQICSDAFPTSGGIPSEIFDTI